MAYVPDATQITEPVSSRKVGSAAAEFRELKTAVAAHETRLDAIDVDTAALEAVLGDDGKNTVRAPIGEELTALVAATARAMRLLGFDNSGNPIASPYTMDQVAAAVAAAYVGGTTADAIGWINELTGSQAQSLQTALRRRKVNIFDCLTLPEQLDVLACSHNYDIGAKLQAFSDAVYLRGGGVIEWPVGHYAHSNDLWIKQRVTWIGEGGSFREPYSDPYPAPEGTVLWKIAGSNNNGVLIKCDLTNIGGVLYDTGFGTSKRNASARHSGGIRGFTLWGNRSANPLFTAKDRNNAGYGIYAAGARNISIIENCSMMWADDGINFGTVDYGTGLIGVNVATVRDNTVMANSRNGWGGTLADSRISGGTVGFNGAHGLSMYLGNTVVTGMTSWNNGGGGFYCSGMASSSQGSLVGCFAYDNGQFGFCVDGAGGGRAVILQSCNARGNGRNPDGLYTNAWDRANYYVTSSAQHWALLGCVSNAYDQTTTITPLCGFYINNVNYAGRLEACYDDGLCLSYTSPFIAKGENVNRASVGNAAFISTNADDLRTTVTANNLDIGVSTNIVFAASSALVINTISYTGPGRPRVLVRNAGTASVTFTYGSSTIKSNTLANVVMAPNQAYWICSINSTNTLWQIIGG